MSDKPTMTDKPIIDDEAASLWDRLYETDPKYTKKVKHRGGFTAIDAYYQIEKITRVFGACGDGWGYSINVLNDGRDGKDIIIELDFWYGNPGDSKSFPILNSIQPGPDAFKKLVTDSLTKAFSMLGCDAGVFKGEFDSNKYVGQEKEKPPSDNGGRLTPPSGKGSELLPEQKDRMWSIGRELWPDLKSKDKGTELWAQMRGVFQGLGLPGDSRTWDFGQGQKAIAEMERQLAEQRALDNAGDMTF